MTKNRRNLGRISSGVTGFAVAVSSALPAWAQMPGLETQGSPLILAALDPSTVGVIGSCALGIAAVAWAIRSNDAANSLSADWSKKLADMEARLEKSDGILSAHPGLVLVWEDDYEAIDQGWGAPRILGGPAALASLMSFAKDVGSDAALPVATLLDTLGALPLDDGSDVEDIKQLKDKVRDLRGHGIAFSGSVVTTEGRLIEADGRVAGSQVALWLTDPAVRMAEEGSVVGKIRDNAADLHGALAQLEKSPFPAWRRASDLKINWVNAAYVEAVEAENANIVVKQQIELDASVRRIAEKAQSERQPVNGRVCVNIKGERKVLSVSETPAHAAGTAAIAGFAIDISELERTRGDLTQHIEANRRTLDQLPVAISLFGVNQELQYYNNAFTSLWGLDEATLNAKVPHGEFLDKLRHNRVLPEQADYNGWKARQLALYTQEVAAPGQERNGQAPDEIWNLPDGRVIRVASSRHPRGGVLVLFEDITEKMKLEARFNTQLNVQRATLNNLAEGVAVFGADGLLHLHNTAFQKLWRLDNAALSARPHIEKVMASMNGRVKHGGDVLESVKRRATSFSPEDRTPIREGILTLTDGRTFSFGTEPLPDGATLVFFLDITDSREREKELRDRNAFLEDIDHQKSKFVDHVSYNLRTPLNTILGFTEMLEGQMFGVLNDRQKDYVASILTAAHHLRDLITDIIDLAAIDAGKLELDTETVDVRDLLTNAATYAALKAEDTQVKLHVQCPSDIGAIEADPQRLKQVLFNLLSNAFAYTGSGGSVTLGADKSPGLLRFWVTDSGRGVSTGDQAKAFDAFESSGPSAGAGLGLSLVQRFINLHGGWVRMESSPGEGTNVTCFLPAGQKKMPAPMQENDGSVLTAPDASDDEKGNRAPPDSDKTHAAE